MTAALALAAALFPGVCDSPDPMPEDRGGRGVSVYDMLGSWCHEKEESETIRRAVAVQTFAADRAGLYERPSVAILMDEKTRLLAERVAYDSPNAVWRTSGVVPAIRSLDDVTAVDLPDYRLYVLWNAVSLSRDAAFELRHRAEEGACVVVAGPTGICSRDFASQDEALGALGDGIVRIESAGDLDAARLNELARRAGARVYAAPGNVTFVGNGVACVHRIAGPVEVDFGREVTPVDLATGRTSAPVRKWTPAVGRHGLAFMTYLPFASDNRPYEFRNANRTLDDTPALLDFETGGEWRAAAAGGAADCGSTSEEQLFGRKTLRLSYRGTGGGASVTFGPVEPVCPSEPWDTFAVWVHGNHFGRGANAQAGIPSPELLLRMRLQDGTERRFSLGRIDWPDWHRVERRFQAEDRERLRGASFAGFLLEGGVQREWRRIHLDNVAFFRDDLSGRLDVVPRPQRNLSPLKGAELGVNTGAGRLPFPVSEDTVIPPTRDPSEGDVLADFSGGAVAGSDLSRLEVRKTRRGRSLVVDFFAPAGTVTEVTAGRATEARVVRSFAVPYLAYGDGKDRLRVDLLEGGWYRCALFDWYRSNASVVSARDGAQAVRYLPKTDGTFNPVSERLVITVSREFSEVLPVIANPASPHKAVTGRNAWHAHASFDRSSDKAFWKAVKGLGIDHVVINDHETLWRDRGESFTFRTDAAPGRGGDAAEADYARFLRCELGYVYGPYNNYTDLSPMNAEWTRDLVGRLGNGSLVPAWFRCYGPKPVLVPRYCERIVPIVQGKFGFNTAYCDVHSAVAPWARTDYDARIPGAATFAQTFYAYGELMLLQKKGWNGPVYSEGGHHFLYSGLTDGNYAQDRAGYDFLKDPWIVDFDLLRIHPKECNFGMGLLSMFAPRKGYVPNYEAVGGRDELIDLFLTAEVAFGHAPYLILDYCFDPPRPFGLAYCGPGKLAFEQGVDIALRSYCMVQPLASYYTQADVRTISYVDAGGRQLPTSGAIAADVVRRNQVVVSYADGTVVVANGSLSERLSTDVGGRRIDLPPRAFWGWSGDGCVESRISEDASGRRTYFCRCPEFTFDGKRLSVRR